MITGTLSLNSGQALGSGTHTFISFVEGNIICTYLRYRFYKNVNELKLFS